MKIPYTNDGSISTVSSNENFTYTIIDFNNKPVKTCGGDIVLFNSREAASKSCETNIGEKPATLYFTT